ncbi:MAG: molybdopterin biosynthesis protein, partial [Oscillospiraceae bacterium]
MSFEYLTNQPLEQAVEMYIDAIKKCSGGMKTERVSVRDAMGRYTADAVYAEICAPHYNACAMDGIALDASLTFGSSETTPSLLRECDFVRVDTGDPLPENSNCVIMIEDVVECGNGEIRLYSAAAPWQHVRRIGEDICAGEMILPSYTAITPAAAGAMLAAGVLSVQAVCPPVIGIIPTGDEIVAPTESPKSGDIIEFNSTIFSGMLAQWGAVPRTYPIAKDNPDDIISALQKACGECDAVILNAGSSAGREDYSEWAIGQLGEVVLHGIAIKPGKPAILGLINDKPVIGVPGYPVSGIIVLEQIFKPVVDFLCGRSASSAAPTQSAVSSRAINSSLKYREFIRARVGRVEDRLVAVPLGRGAGVISSFVKADGIIDIPQNSEGCEAGGAVSVTLLKPISEIDNMLVVTGSHDPLIDEVSDIMNRGRDGFSIASSHVGSMGGVMALRRKEAHMGGIHLLDENDGTYNISYLKKYFKQDEIALVRGVMRVQGLIVPKGNPKKIGSVADLADGTLSFINRQKGSGTRILLDFLLKKSGVEPNQIKDYEREEYTHTGVAAGIAA